MVLSLKVSHQDKKLHEKIAKRKISSIIRNVLLVLHQHNLLEVSSHWNENAALRRRKELDLLESKRDQLNQNILQAKEEISISNGDKCDQERKDYLMKEIEDLEFVVKEIIPEHIEHIESQHENDFQHFYGIKFENIIYIFHE